MILSFMKTIVLDLPSWAYLIHDDEFDEDVQTIAQTIPKTVKRYQCEHCKRT